MSTISEAPEKAEIDYPESDGKPMADNTLQFQWITTIEGGLEALFRHDPNVFVAGDLLWYPVKGDKTLCTAPDVMVAVGRPKGHRGSYRQWREGGVAPQVVFEILSPENRLPELIRKFQFYEEHGVEEYYIYDPKARLLDGWHRIDGKLRPIAETNGWQGARLRIRFDLSSGELRIIGPDGQAFLTYPEVVQQREDERRRADDERQRADDERQRANDERQRADDERQRADGERLGKERLAAQLRALGVEPEV